MKDALNTRGQPYKRPHPALEQMEEKNYELLMKLIRSYRSTELLKLTRYRDVRTHRVAPSVDHSELAVDIASVPLMPGSPIQLFSTPTALEYTFLNLYELAKGVYSHLSELLNGLTTIIHA